MGSDPRAVNLEPHRSFICAAAQSSASAGDSATRAGNCASRVICGYHWQSDIDAARIIAAAVVARLHGKAVFTQQMEKAKAEFKRLSAGGVPSAENVPEQEQIKH